MSHLLGYIILTKIEHSLFCMGSYIQNPTCTKHSSMAHSRLGMVSDRIWIRFRIFSTDIGFIHATLRHIVLTYDTSYNFMINKFRNINQSLKLIKHLKSKYLYQVTNSKCLTSKTKFQQSLVDFIFIKVDENAVIDHV